MKQLQNPYVLLVYIASIICIPLLVCILLKSCSDKEVPSPTTNIEKAAPAPPKHYTDDSGYTHAEAPVTTAADVTAINEYYQSIIADLVKRLPQKTKVSDVQEVKLVGTTDSNNFKPRIDTIYKDGKPLYQSINYKSKWFKFNGNTHPDSVWHLVATDSIALLTYWKRSGFLRLKRELYIDGFSFNPDINVKGLTAIKLNAAQPKKWGIGFTLGYGIGKDLQPQPFVGFGIQRTFIRF